MKHHHESPDRATMPVQGNTYTVSREGKELFTALIADYKPASCWADVEVVSAKAGFEEYYPQQSKMRLKVAMYSFEQE
ncbi:MAG: hypothetical protein ACK5GO_07695 [Ignavibacteria bacterium]|jgi:hypothetical protein